MLSCRVVKQLQGRYARYTTVVPKALVMMYNLKGKYIEWMPTIINGILKVKVKNYLDDSKSMSKIYEATSKGNVSYKVTVPKDFVELHYLQNVSFKWERGSDTEFNLVVIRPLPTIHDPICFGEYRDHPQGLGCPDHDRCRDRRFKPCPKKRKG